MLHAWRLEFPHPIRGTVISVEAPLPPDFERVLRRLRGR
jgi:23S rRNA pseudouridine1911/1915/1917 synthase